jgi:hypothetical protein
VALFLASAAASTFANGSGLDVFGCRENRKAGDYHCHRGRFAGTSFGSKAEMLRRSEGQQPKPAPTTAPERPAAQTRSVTRVVDGDTLVLDGGEHVRLIGVDTPETKHPTKPVEHFGKEASAFACRMAEGKRCVARVG